MAGVNRKPHTLTLIVRNKYTLTLGNWKAYTVGFVVQ